jgi:hypothetical protein
MDSRKLVLLGLFSVVGVMSFGSDAEAGRRKRGGCNTCATPCNTCGGGYTGGGYMHAGYAGGYMPAGGCNTCGGGYSSGGYMPAGGYATAGGCSTCGSGVASGTVMSGGVPMAMPMPGSSGTVVSGGTTTTADGTVIPSGGIITSGGYVMPAGGSQFYTPGYYGSYSPNGFNVSNGYNGLNSYDQTFDQGVIQGALGMPTYSSPYYGGTTIQNSAGRRLGGLFRR